MSASKQFPAGETIAQGVATWIGPGFVPQQNSFYPHPICLGCYTYVLDIYECERCKWPLCSRECMDQPWHKNFECPIIKKHKIPFNEEHLVPEYYRISILRIILLALHHPDEFVKIQRYIDHRRSEIRIRSTDSDSQMRFTSIAQAIEKKFFLTTGSVDTGLMAGIYRTLLLDGVFLNLPSNRACTALYDVMLPIGFSCVPNCRFNHYPNRDGRTDFTVEVYALQEIPKGGRLYRALDENFLLKGTYERRKALRATYEYSCSCERCSDPTELGTYFSAVKCRVKECNETGGLLLPLRPLENSMNAEWKCSKCPYRSTQKEISEFVDSVLADVVNSTRVTRANIVGRSAMVNLVEGSESILNDCLVILHENHYALWPLRNALIGIINGSLMTLCPVPRMCYAEKIMDQAHLTIAVLNMILPGISPIKAKAYYQMSRAVSIEVVPELAETVNTITVREVMKRSALVPLKKLENATPPADFGDVPTMIRDLERWIGWLQSAVPAKEAATDDAGEASETAEAGTSTGRSRQSANSSSGESIKSEKIVIGSSKSAKTGGCNNKYASAVVGNQLVEVTLIKIGTNQPSSSSAVRNQNNCNGASSTGNGQSRTGIKQNGNGHDEYGPEEGIESITSGVENLQVSGSGKPPKKRRTKKRSQAATKSAEANKN